MKNNTNSKMESWDAPIAVNPELNTKEYIPTEESKTYLKRSKEIIKDLDLSALEKKATKK